MSTGSEDRVLDAMSDRDFWYAVLSAGGATEIPNWRTSREPGERSARVAVPAELDAAVRRFAERWRVPVSAVHLGAHVAVLGALSGEQDVVTGYRTDDAVLPCRLSTRDRTWAELVEDAAAAERAVLAHRDFPIAELARELDRTEPLYATTLRTSGDPHRSGPAADAVEFDCTAGRIRVRCPESTGDAEYAERLAGYHLTALRHLTEGPDESYRRHGLLTPDEHRRAVEGMAGPVRELPDQRFHELFERRAAGHPDRIAAELGDETWTYARLNAQANRIARALVARGLRSEDVVGVVTERNLDWMAAVLAVFKAGGAYLPIEPDFPADRMTDMLHRSETRLVLVQRGTEPTVRALDADVEPVLIENCYAEDRPGGDLGITVGADQLAYLYFTSGSTGRPKGVMCEQRGMLNHLLAKIDDLRIGERGVVAQTAPQCFDISLWQLVAALLVGGRTVLVPQEAVLDVTRFVRLVAESGVQVLQLVPSYLEVVLAHLADHPRELPDLRCASATGEALKEELVQRWFACLPRVGLVNAYGLTETSDDTNHEVLTSPPDGRVPLGRAIANVHIYVVDEALRPVPLGAPGEIVFSGMCVGRGYINDPERTRAAFLDDPIRPGERLYRSGDFGRWRPDGRLEFLGRRDAQVKIRGFRIEIGEIENRLLRAPGVRDGAVVVVERDGRPQALAAFYAADAELDPAVLRDSLAASLPEYMVPAHFHFRAALPLTGNGKIDKKSLAEQARPEADSAPREAPSTPVERELAERWAAVLDLPVHQVGRHDHFFEVGGTSLSAIRLVVGLERRVSLQEVVRHPVLADLARALGDRAGAAPVGS